MHIIKRIGCHFIPTRWWWQTSVITYNRRLLHPSERSMQNCSSVKLELLALKWAIKENFYDNLLGSRCTMHTDKNQSLYEQRNWAHYKFASIVILPYLFLAPNIGQRFPTRLLMPWVSIHSILTNLWRMILTAMIEVISYSSVCKMVNWYQESSEVSNDSDIEGTVHQLCGRAIGKRGGKMEMQSWLNSISVFNWLALRWPHIYTYYYRLNPLWLLI